MTLDDLKGLIHHTPWFTRLGEFGLDGDYVQIGSLAPWGDESTDDPELERIAAQLDWLPSTRSEADPIHGTTLEDRAEERGIREHCSKEGLALYRVTLTALRSIDDISVLRAGSYHFAEAARNSALYAVRRAVFEVMLESPDFWCHVLHIYRAGRWPCGRMPDGRIVVF